jgi:hypothetical protein
LTGWLLEAEQLRLTLSEAAAGLNDGINSSKPENLYQWHVAINVSVLF